MGASAASACCVSRDGHCEADETQRPVSSRVSCGAVPAEKPLPKVKKAPERPVLRRKSSSALLIEDPSITHIRGRMGSLNSVLGDIRDEMTTLRSANGDLLRKNDDLMGENKRLKDFLNERTATKAWRKFDVVEHHYQELEKHRTIYQKADESSDPIPPRRACHMAAAGA